MPSLIISSRQFPELHQLSRAYERYTGGSGAPRRMIAELMLDAIVDNPNIPYKTGRYKRGFRRRISGAEILMVNRVNYSGYVEAGIPSSKTKNRVRRAIRKRIPQIKKQVQTKYPLPRGKLSKTPLLKVSQGGGTKPLKRSA